MKNITPGQALLWATVALVIAILAIFLGIQLDPYNQGNVRNFLVGLLAMIASGVTASFIAQQMRKAIFG